MRNLVLLICFNALPLGTNANYALLHKTDHKTLNVFKIFLVM